MLSSSSRSLALLLFLASSHEVSLWKMTPFWGKKTPDRSQMSTWNPLSKLRGCATTGRGSRVALPDLVGKGALAQMLTDKGIPVVELPCIAFEKTDCALDRALLEEWEWVVISAPEAASLFADAWAVSRPNVNIACVGEKTRRKLEEKGVDEALSIRFAPSGKDLAALIQPEGSGRLLLPLSVRARPNLQQALGKSGFSVRRLDVYDTVPLPWTEEQQREAEMCSIVALASPTAIEIWQERVGTDCTVVSFGSSSSESCRRAGFREVTFPTRKGLKGWAEEIARISAMGMADDAV